ncbi:MAG: GIY-YIG nuclease family protein [Cyclobacteriaceae bacterium]|nr:GIY-YIG nuclease family protein [Cyclobacteriaceae bacterium]
MKSGHVYIMANKHNTVLYTGVTSDLVSRVLQHKEKFYPLSFTAKYNCNKLLYYEFFQSIEQAIQKEKYIKGKSRTFKERLIEKHNPDYNDLWIEINNW